MTATKLTKVIALLKSIFVKQPPKPCRTPWEGYVSKEELEAEMDRILGQPK